jgi:hypothetical protein
MVLSSDHRTNKHSYNDNEIESNKMNETQFSHNIIFR